MNNLLLIRDSYGPKETLGRFMTARIFHSIERPWIKDPDHPGGMSFESCVPDGTYDLVPHTRPNGDKVVALVNPDLGVWYRKEDRPDGWGRYLVLLHSANFVEEIVGCIAPGLSRTIDKNRRMVTRSRAAMKLLDVRKYTSITIKTTEGAKN